LSNGPIYNVQVAGSASITTGKGDDNVYLWNFTVGGPLDVRTGRGDDSVLAHAVYSAGGKIDGGPGHDRFIVDGAFSGFHIVGFEEIIFAPASA
jgi:hypothetical protein